MNWQSVDIVEVYEIHKAIVKRAGTKASVRDFGLLHSAVERPQAMYEGKFLYPTKFLRAAALLQSLTRNHPFTDGNKRTAWVSTKRLLYKNNFHLMAERKDAGDFMVSVDNEKLELKEIANWLTEHCSEIG